MVDTFAWISLVDWNDDITKLDFVNDKYMVRGRYQRREDVISNTGYVIPGADTGLFSQDYILLKNKTDVPTRSHPGALNEFAKLDYTLVVEFDLADPEITYPGANANYDYTPPPTFSDTDTFSFLTPGNGVLVGDFMRTGFMFTPDGQTIDTKDIFRMPSGAVYRRTSTIFTYDKEDFDYWVIDGLPEFAPGPFQHGSKDHYVCPVGGLYGTLGIPYEQLPDQLQWQHDNWAVTARLYESIYYDTLDESIEANIPECRRFVPTTLYGRTDVPNPYERTPDSIGKLRDGYENSFFRNGDGQYQFMVRRTKYWYLGYEFGPYGFNEGHDPFPVGYQNGTPYYKEEYAPGFFTWALPNSSDYGIIPGRVFDAYGYGGYMTGNNLVGWMFESPPWGNLPFGPSSRKPTKAKWLGVKSTQTLIGMTYTTENTFPGDPADLRMVPETSKRVFEAGDADVHDLDILTGGAEVNKNGRNRLAITIAGKYMAMAINGSDPMVVEQEAGFPIPRVPDVEGTDPDTGNPVKYYSSFDWFENGAGHFFTFSGRAKYVRCAWLYRKKKPTKFLSRLSEIRPLPDADDPHWRTR